jgi:hypothetical protein
MGSLPDVCMRDPGALSIMPRAAKLLFPAIELVPRPSVFSRLGFSRRAYPYLGFFADLACV